jgi:hypothetical protein
MYGVSSVAVDKGLGFDFSAISNFVKQAATTGLNVYQQQVQLKQMKQMGYMIPGFMPNPSLPMSNQFAPQPTFGTPMYVQPSSGMGTGTMLAIIGGVGALAALAFMMKK